MKQQLLTMICCFSLCCILTWFFSLIIPVILLNCLGYCKSIPLKIELLIVHKVKWSETLQEWVNNLFVSREKKNSFFFLINSFNLSKMLRRSLLLKQWLNLYYLLIPHKWVTCGIWFTWFTLFQKYCTAIWSRCLWYCFKKWCFSSPIPYTLCKSDCFTHLSWQN